MSFKNNGWYYLDRYCIGLRIIFEWPIAIISLLKWIIVVVLLPKWPIVVILLLRWPITATLLSKWPITSISESAPAQLIPCFDFESQPASRACCRGGEIVNTKKHYTYSTFAKHYECI
jgi:hypothetical protein